MVNGQHGSIDAGFDNNGAGISCELGDEDGDTVSVANRSYGEVRGGGNGLRLFSSVEDATFEGDFYNAGLISGSTVCCAAVGISIVDGIILDGKILNYGRIGGPETAIDATEAGGDVEVANFGRIIGNARLSDCHSSYDGAHGRVKGIVDGGGDDDKLTGGSAKDFLAGGADDDTLTGGHACDVFNFRTADAGSADMIADFEDGTDRIDARDFGFASASDIEVAGFLV